MFTIKELKEIGFKKYPDTYEYRINKDINKGTVISHLRCNFVKENTFMLETSEDSILLKVDTIEDLKTLIKMINI